MSNPRIAGLAEAVDALRAGELVVYPTETFYALGAYPFSQASMNKLFALKRRDPEKPVALIAADSKMAFELASSIPPLLRRLADTFWPGPLTIVVPARAGIPAELIGPDGGVGVRVSPHPVARALCEELRRPITATSANLSGEPPALTLAASAKSLGKQVKVYLEGGTLRADAPSTVVAVEADKVRVIREGAITERQILAALSAGALE